MFAYCRNGPVFRIDISGKLDLECNSTDPLSQEDDRKDWTGSGDNTAATGTMGPSQAPDTSSNSYNFGGSKGVSYANKRGWSDEMINEAIASGATGSSTNLANGEDCVVYNLPGDSSQYVVIETISRNVVQLTKIGDSNWIPDENIIWFHMDIDNLS